MPTGGERGAREAVSPLWLSHHFPEQYDRCALIGSHHVCRRCLALYPLAFAVMFLSLAGVHWPASWDGVLLVVLPLPAVVEFVTEQLGVVRYRPRRQVLVTIPLAIALGRGFALYADDPGSPLFWAIVVAYGGVCSAALAVRFRRDKHSV